MKLTEALKFFKDYSVTFNKNNLGLYEVKAGNITIPSISMSTDVDVFTSKLIINDMLGEETVIKFAEILQSKLEEARKL